MESDEEMTRETFCLLSTKFLPMEMAGMIDLRAWVNQVS